MNQITLNIFKSIHEGKWLSIAYKNKKDELTNYWIAIQAINVKQKSLSVEGFHITKHTIAEFNYIYLDAILSAEVVQESYYPINRKLVNDIECNPKKYEFMFGQAVNLKILSYLIECNRLDTQPYKCEYSLIKQLDGASFHDGEYPLSNEQFAQFVKQFQGDIESSKVNKIFQYKQLVMNELSVVVKGKGPKQEALYVMAYRKLNLDVKRRVLRAEEDVTICREFTVDGEKESIRKYLPMEDYDLLGDFEANKEEIKNRITTYSFRKNGVDDRPYVIAIARDVKVDLNKEYKAIIESVEEGRETYPIRAFFGKLTGQPSRRKEYPLALLKRQANLDQLLAIHNAVKYPMTYVQGPPGTGKSYTIINTIITAFFNEKTVLLASYNNHPINSVVESLKKIPYKNGSYIPFPIIRLGSNVYIKETLKEIKEKYEIVKNLKVFEGTLEKNRDQKIDRTKRLTELLKKYEEKLELKERKEAIEHLMNGNGHLTFQTDLQGRQLDVVKERLSLLGEITDEQALSLIDEDEEVFSKYLNFTSVKYLKRLGEPKNSDLRNILDIENEDKQIKAFNVYLSEEENVKKLLRIFPIVATSCISAHKIGSPKPYFDMTIMDEASQCNMAMSLLPIIRGENLMLVGDPQQLNPVILLDSKDNEILKQRYQIPQEYDYIKNSIYKAFLANDAVSEEILLRHHYRCCKAIIEFNNRKYYNNKLCIETKLDPKHPIVYADIENNVTDYKNTAPKEAEEIVNYIRLNQDKEIGIITPFTNQKECINSMLKENNIKNAACGTVHAFQGDEKDIILFSTALTDQTSEKTYGWLKNNKELINVATSRAREKLILFASDKNLERLHNDSEHDDIYELAQYIKTNGKYEVTPDTVRSRALGIKPYSTKTEEAFMESLNHALDNILNNNRRCSVRKEVAISQVFQDNVSHEGLFFNGRFDFVIYEREYGGKEIPILALELDGKEHQNDEIVKRRDIQKTNICKEHGFELIRVENSYARRYYYIKEILEDYFKQIK